MGQLERLTAMNGETLPLVHEKEILQIMDEMNSQETATAQVNDALKKAATATFSFGAADWQTTASPFYNRIAFQNLQHGLGYTPIAFGYVSIYGQILQLPYNDYRTTDGVYQGSIDILPFPNSVRVIANYNNVTPDWVAYIFVTTATGTQSTAS
jgi:hypothetical protein